MPLRVPPSSRQRTKSREAGAIRKSSLAQVKRAAGVYSDHPVQTTVQPGAPPEPWSRRAVPEPRVRALPEALQAPALLALPASARHRIDWPTSRLGRWPRRRRLKEICVSCKSSLPSSNGLTRARWWCRCLIAGNKKLADPRCKNHSPLKWFPLPHPYMVQASRTPFPTALNKILKALVELCGAL